MQDSQISDEKKVVLFVDDEEMVLKVGSLNKNPSRQWIGWRSIWKAVNPYWFWWLYTETIWFKTAIRKNRRYFSELNYHYFQRRRDPWVIILLKDCLFAFWLAFSSFLSAVMFVQDAAQALSVGKVQILNNSNMQKTIKMEALLHMPLPMGIGLNTSTGIIHRVQFIMILAEASIFTSKVITGK